MTHRHSPEWICGLAGLLGLILSGCATPGKATAPDAQGTPTATNPHHDNDTSAGDRQAPPGAPAPGQPPAGPRGSSIESDPPAVAANQGAQPTPETKSKLRVVVQGVSGELRENVDAFLSIRALETEGAPSEARVRWLHAKAKSQIREALIPFGYYRPSVRAELERSDGGWLAAYQIHLGEPVRIRRSSVRLIGEGRTDKAFADAVRQVRLKEGEILVHSQYEEAKTTLQSLAVQRGYFDARFTTNQVTVEPAQNSADVRLVFDTGPRYHFGTVSFEQDFLDSDLLERYQHIEPGTPYLARELVRLQGNLAGSNYFESVAMDASPKKAREYTIPVVIGLTPSQNNRYEFRVGYGTDTGARASAGYVRRRVNRYGHGFTADLFLSENKSGISSEYSIPGYDPQTDRYLVRAGYVHEDTTSFTSDKTTFGISHQQQRRPWRRTLSLDYQIERSEFDDDANTSKLLMPGVDWVRVSPDDRLRVERGTRLHLNVRGAHEDVLSDVSFLQGRVDAKFVHPFARGGRFLIRTGGGSTLTEDFEEIPATIRFYAGGDRSVRGYKLDSIGPEDSDGNVIGGKHLVFGSAEYEHEIVGAWSAAVFADVGDAFTDSFKPKVGAGVGVRWNSPVGPVRVDIAHGFQDPGDPVRLHINIGPDL